MSNTRDACSYSDKITVECIKSPNKKHEYEVELGSWPSCKMKCKHCGDTFYTK